MKSLCIYNFKETDLATIERDVPYLVIGVKHSASYNIKLLGAYGAQIELIRTVKNPKYIGEVRDEVNHMLEVAWVTFPSVKRKETEQVKKGQEYLKMRGKYE